MKKRRAPAKNHSARGAHRSTVVDIPKDVAAAIKRCWPHGVVEEFPTDESYFHEIRRNHKSPRFRNQANRGSAAAKHLHVRVIQRGAFNPDGFFNFQVIRLVAARSIEFS